MSDGKANKAAAGGSNDPGNTKGKPVSAKAGVKVPGRVNREDEDIPTDNQVAGATAAVYMAAILEYLTAERLETAGNVSNRREMRRATPRPLSVAVGENEERDMSTKRTVFPNGGALPDIREALVGKRERPPTPE